MTVAILVIPQPRFSAFAHGFEAIPFGDRNRLMQQVRDYGVGSYNGMIGHQRIWAVRATTKPRQRPPEQVHQPQLERVPIEGVWGKPIDVQFWIASRYFMSPVHRQSAVFNVNYYSQIGHNQDRAEHVVAEVDKIGANYAVRGR